MTYVARDRRRDVALRARGLINETYELANAQSFPTTVAAAGSASRVLAGFLGGDVITGLACWCLTSAGTGLTLVKMGVWDRSHTLLAATASFHGTLATGLNAVTLTAPYTIPSDDGYYLGIVPVGTTGPTLVRSAATSSINGAAINSGLPVTIGNGGQTDAGNLSANANTGTAFWLAAY